MHVRTPMVICSLGIALAGGACSLANDPGEPDPPGEGGGGIVPAGPGAGGDGGDRMTTTTTSGQGGEGGVVMPECTVDDDCDMLDDECNDGVCNVDSCLAVPKATGTPCGDSSEGTCDAADSCFDGECRPNHIPNGTYCDTCPAGAGQCTGCQDGACGDCTTFASVQTFTRPSSIAGWVTTGDWRLYRYAPISGDRTEVDFGKYVFGTDGNRSQPYPGGESEMSSAVTTPFTMPANLEFQSWHLDEGGFGLDQKSIDVSTDGGATWQPLYDCNMAPQLPFCMSFGGTRLATEWDAISIPVPPGLVGQTAQLRFRYDTGDSCCGFERGWFIDALNVATECACTDDAACAFVAAEDGCGVGACDMATNECVVGAPANEGLTCGDDPMEMASDCNQLDACKGGYCDEQVLAFDAMCGDCATTSSDACNGCDGTGVCRDCNYANFFSSINDLTGWTLTGDWGRYTTAPVSQSYTSVVNFGSMFGTDGNRSQPYPGPGELENSTATSPTFAVPAQITFSSWHVDESFDHKSVFLSVDGGTTWIPLADCTAAPPLDAFPFCQTVNTDRPANPKDSIVLDTSAYQGMQGILQFRYNTNDSCCTFERGWYIDSLNVGRECY